MAPEVVRHERYSKKADVFSYSMVLYELLTHEVPFADRPALQAVVAVALNEQRPLLPDGTPLPLRQLLTSCWARDAAGDYSCLLLVAADCCWLLLVAAD